MSGVKSEVKNYEKFLNDLEIRYGVESKQEIQEIYVSPDQE